MNLVKETPGKKKCELGERNTREKRNELDERNTREKRNVNLVSNIRGKCSHSHKQLELPSAHHLSEAKTVTLSLCLNMYGHMHHEH